MISRPTLFSVPGGDTVQIRETANALSKQGVEVEIKLSDQKIDYSGFDLIHFFNVIRPNAILLHVRRSGLPYVVSTIFVDYSEVEQIYRGQLAKSLYRIVGADGIEYFKTVARWLMNGEKILDNQYLFRGHKKSVELVLNKASVLLPNSESEFRRLEKRYQFETKHAVIPNAVDTTFFTQPLASHNRSGVVCVARIEPIKNQLNLIKALKNTSIQLKLIGQASPNRQAYFEECKAAAGPNVSFLGQMNKEQVLKELLQAKVHILPSWFETTGLSSLEAAIMGCNIVVTPKGDTEEYFDHHAFYCQPDDLESIRIAIEKALEVEVSNDLREKILREYTWEIAATKTASAYRDIIE